MYWMVYGCPFRLCISVAVCRTVICYSFSVDKQKIPSCSTLPEQKPASLAPQPQRRNAFPPRTKPPTAVSLSNLAGSIHMLYRAHICGWAPGADSSVPAAPQFPQEAAMQAGAGYGRLTGSGGHGSHPFSRWRACVMSHRPSHFAAP